MVRLGGDALGASVGKKGPRQLRLWALGQGAGRSVRPMLAAMVMLGIVLSAPVTGRWFGATPAGAELNCGSSMGPPSYPGSTWTAADLTNDDNFQNLNNWNYGFTDTPTSGPGGGYYPWYASGSAPYWGSSEGPTYADDYDLPGNVSQTTTGSNSSLLSTYKPQVFDPAGCGVTLTAHHTGPRTWQTTSGAVRASWTSGAINSYGKISFPTQGRSSFYVQIRAQTMGYGNSDNGAWNALWFLGQGGSYGEMDLQETGIDGTNNPNVIDSHVRPPVTQVEDYDSPWNLSAGYHVYGLMLSGNVVNIYLDNQQVGSVAWNETGPYFLLMNGSVFQQGLSWAPGPSVFTNMKMKIAEVQVYQR